MKKIFKILLAVIIIGIVCGLIMLKYVYKKADVSVGSKKADIRLEASALLKIFQANEDSANILYLNKIVLVKGLVDNVSGNEQGYTVYLKNKEDAAGIVCGFDKSAFDPGNIKNGEQISVKGICTGLLIDDVVLSKCSTEK
jgi:hypothetical protein